MYRFLVALVNNEQGFTAIEYGILAGLVAIFVEKIVAPF